MRDNFKKSIIFMLSFLFILAACQPKDDAETITPELLQDSKDKNYQLIDVRTPSEFEEGHIEGAKLINIHDEDFKSRVKELPKEETYVIYCKSGSRSANATEIFKEAGFKKVYNLEGGIENWKSKGHEVVK